MTHDEIFTKVKTTLMDALNVDEGEVTPTARLKGDLNPSPSTSWTSCSASSGSST